MIAFLMWEAWSLFRPRSCHSLLNWAMVPLPPRNLNKVMKGLHDCHDSHPFSRVAMKDEVKSSWPLWTRHRTIAGSLLSRFFWWRASATVNLLMPSTTRVFEACGAVLSWDLAISVCSAEVGTNKDRYCLMRTCKTRFLRQSSFLYGFCLDTVNSNYNEE